MSRLFSRNRVVLFSVALLTALSFAEAADETAQREPIVITANRMDADKLGDTVRFTGSVVLKKENMTLNSDHLIVYYDPPAKGVREIEALGSVVVTKEGRVALASKAIYYSREEKIVLTGDARIIENENQLGGDKITLFMRDDRSVVEGGKVLIYQDKIDEAAGGLKTPKSK